MANPALFILQSGFVALANPNLVKTTDQEPTIRELIIFDNDVESNQHHYDASVNGLFTAWSEDNRQLLNFSFREAILKKAIELFSVSGPTMTDWFNMQLRQKSVGYLNQKFMLDILKYVYNDQPKSMDNTLYFRLLQSTESNTIHNTAFEVPGKEIRQYLADICDARITDFLFRWTGSTDGFADLLYSLRVIFGERGSSQLPSRQYHAKQWRL